MSAPHPQPITRLLDRLSGGDGRAAEELLPRIYGELHRIAQGCMSAEPNGHTLQPTALVHEAWMRLVGSDGAPRANDRSHFFRLAARAMRQVLIDHARRKQAAKRRLPEAASAVERVLEGFAEQSLDVLTLNEALERLAEVDEELSRIVELRFFAGLTVPEVASALGASVSTVERRWRQARAWLRAELPPSAPPS